MEQIINNPQTISFAQLAQQIVEIDNHTKRSAYKTINQMATLRNWLIGAYIVEYEQNGCDRAQYGDNLIYRLSKMLGDKRYSSTLLKNCRSFYRLYPHVSQLIVKSPMLSDFFGGRLRLEICPMPSDKFETKPELLISRLSFSHIVEILAIKDPLIRYFYETEAIKGVWSVKELRRQISTNLHIRVGLSADKIKALSMVNENTRQDTALQIRDPYVFEFLGLSAKDAVSESDLEDALITNLQNFLLELGNGFCLEARQKRIIIDDEYYYADLVFYNRVLHCNVIVELKNDEFRHEHIGQLNAYVGYYAENEMQPGDNPPIGILLCTRKGTKMVEYALGSMDNQLFVSTYKLQLPQREELERFIRQECGDIQ